MASDIDGYVGYYLYVDGTSAQLCRSSGSGTFHVNTSERHEIDDITAQRFFLGATEAGLFPGVVYYLSCWYKRKEQHFRISIFFSAASLAGKY